MGRVVAVASYAAVPLALIASWHLVVALALVRAPLPPPAEVLAAWVDLVFAASGDAGRYSGDLPEAAIASTTRVLAGAAIATAVGIALGVAIGLSRPVERLLDPTIQVLRNIPITAWLPIAILFFGISDRPAVFLIALGAVFPNIVNTTYGVRQVNRLVVKAARMMGASRLQLVRRVIVPAASPAILTGVRLGLGVAWVLVVVSELLAVRSGLGYLMWDAYQFFRPDVMIATMFTIGLLGFLSDRALLAVRDRLLAWNRLETVRG